MWRLLTLAGLIAMIFAATFLMIKATGLITIVDIKNLLSWASEVNLITVGLFVSALLFLDIFIAIPTLTVVTLSGYFLGPIFGALFSILGMWAAGLSGYFICRTWGGGLLLKTSKDRESIKEMENIFSNYGVYVLILCRAAPIIPEVTCCLSGINKIKFSKFFLFFSLGTIPYAAIASYAGSKSSIDDPLPGVIGALVIATTLWVGWFFLIRMHYRCRKLTAEYRVSRLSSNHPRKG